MEDKKTPLLPQENKPFEGYSNTRICLFVLIIITYVILFYVSYMYPDTIPITILAGWVVNLVVIYNKTIIYYILMLKN